MGGGASLAASLAAFRDWVGPFRGLFFLVAVVLVARSHYLYWGGLRERAKWATTVPLWVSTGLTLAMTYVFYIYDNPMFF